MTTKLEFLAQHPLFRELDEEDLEDLATAAAEYEYEDGAIVAYQRDIADCLIILKSGRLYAEKVERGRVVDSKAYEQPNAYFGLDWLFFPGIHPATVRAAAGHGRATRLIIFESKAFLRFLSQNQHVIDYLEPEYDNTDVLIAGFTETPYEEALKIKAKRERRSNTMNILPDELIEFNARRSGYFLLVRMILPIAGLILVALIPFAFFSSQPPDSILYNLQFYCPGFLSLFFIGWAIFRFLDWTNDYFIVTNLNARHRQTPFFGELYFFARPDQRRVDENL
jgi:CRP-like cAMP-binding protein